MTTVSTVSSGSSGTYGSYESRTATHDTDSVGIGFVGGSRTEFAESYEGTGPYKNQCPRNAPECVSANIGRRACGGALCGRAGARRRSGVAA